MKFKSSKNSWEVPLLEKRLFYAFDKIRATDELKRKTIKYLYAMRRCLAGNGLMEIDSHNGSGECRGPFNS